MTKTIDVCLYNDYSLLVMNIVIPADAGIQYKTKLMTKTYFIYILTNMRNGTLYIGVTNNLARRMYEHKMHLIKGFSDRYNLDRLVYFEETNDILSAISREKQLKKWNRAWKIELIEKANPNWNDLYQELTN